MRSSIFRAVRTVACVTAVLLCFALFAVTPASAKRVALVIGNSEYQGVPKLTNPINDARGMAELFGALGFEVTHASDLDIRLFAETLAEFEAQASGAEIAAFYFAGHGIQFDGKNYLLPTDAELTNRFLFTAETLPLDAVIETMARVSATSLVFLDACRDNPYLDRLRAGLPASRSAATSRGLARLADRPDETIVVYASAPGQIALDGAGAHSPFAEALMTHLGTPDLEIGLAVRRVIGAVRDATGGQQSPELTVSLTGEIYLNTSGGAVEIAREPAGVANLPDIKMPEFEGDARAELDRLWEEGQALPYAARNEQYYMTMKSAYDLALAEFGPNSHEYAQASNHMIGALTRTGRDLEAAEAAREAVRVFQVLYGPDSTRVANNRANLAGRLRRAGNPDDAEAEYLEAIRIYESVRRMGWDHVGYSSALEGYGVFLAESGNGKDALRVSKQAVLNLEETGYRDTINYGTALSNAASIERRFGQCTQALALYKRAVDAFEDAGVSNDQIDHRNSLRRVAQGCR